MHRVDELAGDRRGEPRYGVCTTRIALFRELTKAAQADTVLFLVISREKKYIFSGIIDAKNSHRRGGLLHDLVRASGLVVTETTYSSRQNNRCQGHVLVDLGPSVRRWKIPAHPLRRPLVCPRLRVAVWLALNRNSLTLRTAFAGTVSADEAPRRDADHGSLPSESCCAQLCRR